MKITSKRLLIRPLALSDAAAVFEYSSDEKVNQYQGRIPKKLDETKEFLRNLESEFGVDRSWFQVAIIESVSNKLIGDIGIHFVNNDSHHVEFGISLSKDNHGKGYAQEALHTIMNFLIKDFSTLLFTVSIDPRNTASINLIERLGFKRTSLTEKAFKLRGKWVDDLIYTLAIKN